jgi:dipeptidyl aminopeptidase/acylaminoacyl peptidase
MLTLLSYAYALAALSGIFYPQIEFYTYPPGGALSKIALKNHPGLNESFTTRFYTSIHTPSIQRTAVQTLVVLPPGVHPGDKPPAIVMIYPGSNLAQDYKGPYTSTEVTLPNALFLSEGYALVLVDLPIGPEGVSGNPLQETYDLLMAQIDHAVELQLIDPERLALMGQSYGGYAVGGMIAMTNRFKTAVAIAGAYDLFGNYGEFGIDSGQYNRNWAETGQGRMGTHPWVNQEKYLKNSPYYLADHIHTPLLLLHGTGDHFCDMRESQKMYSALQCQGREVQLGLYKGEGHRIYDWSKSHADDAAQKTALFLRQHLK